jgi:hypothetical protein
MSPVMHGEGMSGFHDLEGADDPARHEHPAGRIDRIVHPIAEDLAIRAAETSP